MKTIMNKIIFSILTLACLSFSISAMAAPSLSDLHASKYSNKQTTLRSPSRGFTQITIENYSNCYVSFKVPGTYLMDTLGPDERESITADSYFDGVLVVLYDDEGYEFFRDVIPNHGTLEIADCPMILMSNGDHKHAKVKAVLK